MFKLNKTHTSKLKVGDRLKFDPEVPGIATVIATGPQFIAFRWDDSDKPYPVLRHTNCIEVVIEDPQIKDFKVGEAFILPELHCSVTAHGKFETAIRAETNDGEILEFLLSSSHKCKKVDEKP